MYDITDFIPNHPGGSEKIMLAAGKSIDAFWCDSFYRLPTAPGAWDAPASTLPAPPFVTADPLHRRQLYQQHYRSSVAHETLERCRIGNLDPKARRISRVDHNSGHDARDSMLA